MDEIPLLAVIFASIPETMVALTVGLVLFGYKVSRKFGKIFLIAVAFSGWSYFSRPHLPNIEAVALTTLVVQIILVRLGLRLTLRESIFVILSGTVIIGAVQGLITPLALGILGYSLQEVLANLWLRILIPWISSTVVLLLALWLARKGISVTNLRLFLANLKPKHRSSQILVLNLMLQLLVLILICGELWINKSPAELKENAVIIILGIALLVLTVITFVVSKKLVKNIEQEALAETQGTFVSQIEGLFTTVRAQRHDFINHVQVLYSLTNLKDIDEIKSYLNSLLGEIKEVNALIDIKNPVIAALLKTKSAIAEQRGISLKINILTDLEALKVKSYKLVKVLGNLLDNAMEAVVDLGKEEGVITLKICQQEQIYVFEINNRGAVISPEDLQSIFQAGVTSKADSENHGIGLAIVRQLVTEHKGSISVTSNETEGTTFRVSLPA